MSDEIDLNTNNLCTTEDAFEQFQSISMYEENEFIILSDIVSPGPAAADADLAVDINDIPYESEVVLEAQYEEQVPEVNSTVESVSEDNKNTETPSPNPELTVSEDHQESTTVPQPSRRGRKKKNQQSESILTINQTHNEQSNGKQEILMKDGKSTNYSHKPKRGRKPKRKDESFIDSHKNSKLSIEPTEEVHTTKRTLQKRRSSLIATSSLNSTSINENSLVGKSSKKCGKAKKVPIDQQPQSLEEETNEDCLEQNILETDSFNVSENNGVSNNSSKRLRRKKASTKLIFPKEAEIDSVDSVSSLNQSGDQIEDEGIKVPVKPIKSPGKRGRPRKIKPEDISAIHLEKSKDSVEASSDRDDDAYDDICLSKLKKTIDPIEVTAKIEAMDVTADGLLEQNETVEIETESVETIKSPKFETHTDTKYELSINDSTESKQIEESGLNEMQEDGDNSLLVEDTSKRPVRRKAKKTLQYDESSDEDPFANVELSDDDDDEPKRGKKGTKYYSDDEYIPGASKRGNISSSDVSDSDIDEDVDDLMIKQRRKKQKLDDTPRKRGRKPKLHNEEEPVIEKLEPKVETITPNVSDIQNDDDVEICLQSSLIKPHENTKQKAGWGTTDEFENFIAKRIHGTDIKIKKASTVQPLEIPMIEAKDVKKSLDKGSQTIQVKTSSVEAQTSAPYDLPMKDNVPLSSEQTEKACEFLKGIVKTTAELGELMTQKSEDFINKKINTSHITDTFKMDYCVRKSFLLFKLAKHNLMQMEEDLSNQYNEFLSSNNLMKHREAPKVLSVAAKSAESDSDCEIIEGPPTVSKNLKKDKEKPKFNPKTVFLNKELSIKIAKKPSEDKKLNIKSRHTVWINDSVMVKKVKPTQSFLAQDSRNKKPPDCVTIEMVNNFFEEYHRQQALLTCAPFVTTDWISFNKKYVCSYFTKPDEFSTSSLVEIPSSSELVTTPVTDVLTKSSKHFDVQHKLCSPKTLFSLCSQALLNYLNNSFSNPYEKSISVCNANPQTLYCLCINLLNLNFYNIPSGNKQPTLECAISINAMPLKTLCFQKICEIFDTTETETMTRNLVQVNNYEEFYVNDDKQSETSENSCDVPTKHLRSLFSLCVSCLQSQLLPEQVNKKSVSYKNNLKEILQQTPKSLKYISYKKIEKLLQIKTVPRMPIDHIHKVKTLSDLCFKIVTKTFTSIENETPKECLTINSVNTLTEEAYLNIEQSTELTENLEYYADDDTHFYEDETEEGNFSNFDEISNTEDNNWISQLEMKELRSIPNKSTETEKHVDAGNPLDQATLVTRIKLEPEEEPEPIVENSIVKTEPLHNLDEMTIIPESIITKSELIDQVVAKDHIQRKDSSSYDVESFEAFVRSNKMIHALNEHNDFEEIFSQSASRIRRQYEPDSDTENDISMDLLVPQTFEPMHIENAKDVLMESSGDESSNAKKPINKKKLDKRRTKTKKMDPKSDKTKDVSKDKPPTTNEIAVLTRRMREKIRQEEKKIATSDSESEICTLGSPKDKENENVVSKKTKESIKEYSKTKAKINKSIDDEIQCNNVDSTEQFVESLSAKCESPDPSITKFTGFSAVDQNEGHNYQKYVKYVYDKILPQPDNEPQTDADAKKETAISSVINPDDPVELLECEPTIPIFDNEEIVNNLDKQTPKKKIKKSAVHVDSLPYKERHGWKCYPLDTNDTKLYQDAQILLEKLPESFVETYFTYQNISDKNKEDIEVDRLTNLQSLNRLIAKEGKSKSKSKSKTHDPAASKTASDENHSDSRTVSANSDHYDELSPSEDEGVNVDNEPPSPAKKNNFSDNTIAKSSLMDDLVSDDETEKKVEVKKEPEDPNAVDLKPVKKSKPGPKSKCKPVEPADPESLMLTADKMMNKELNLLHAPIVLDEDVKPTLSKGPVTRNRQKCSTKLASDSKRVRADDDSSSEEEKQWFTIKEKLLKKMLNKKDTTREDDAKRAKLVSEFIERRGDLAESFSKRRMGRGRRSKKRMLERQKQLRILSRELFGDPSNDASHQGKTRYNQAYSKGRKNIRKVLDKKSLAKGTVIANMEEFERKRQLNIRQTRLREIMQCEEGVNVLVINDEVCLEYDFDNHRPVVTIHSFFTKVMKAHQYEGVKFMWDACFESLEDIAAGHRGGGCILAHCMGLGKTLQVLALLHTVLTHPRVGMQRVLVCCPLSTVLNWVDEIHKWIGPVTAQIKVFELSKLKKTYERAYQLEDWYNGGGIFIIGYELFRSLTTLDPYLDDVRPTIVNKIRNALLDPGPDIIICDEGHLLKNDCSVLAVAMSRVVTKRRIVLTGTPMQNNLREYYCMVNFVKPNLLGTYAEYSNRFENPIMNGQHRDSREEDIKLMKARTHILHKVLEGCLQRQEASVLYPYLPKKFEYTVFVSLTKCQWDLYKHYLQNCTSNLTSKNNVLKDFHILQKIWSHPQVLHNFQMRSRDDTKSKVKLEKLEDDLAREDLNADLNPAEDMKPDALTDTWWLQYLEGGEMLESLHSSNKFVCVFRILDECIELGDKLLIFSTSLFTMDALEYFLKKNNKWSLGKEYFRLDGSVPAEVRQKWCREFNAEHNVNTKLFLISTRAGCLGLNMTAANRVIILDTSWNPAHDIQSIFRVYRFGQKKDCYIYRLVAMGTMEQKIYERSVTKQAVACRVVDEQQIDRHYNMADLTELYRYDESGVGVAGGVAVGVQDVALLRVARDANLHAVHEHDSLLRGSGEQGLPEHERNAAWVQFQQEHANKQMQNDLETENSKLPIKQVHGHDYAKSPSKQTAVKTEADAPATDTKPKRGKEKKSSVVSCYIPIQPQSPGESKDQTMNQDKEEEIVKKITDILIKHNFNVKQEPRDIAALVDNVRKIVATGRIADIAKTDKLTYSIANVLLAKDLPLPELTNIMCESVNNTLSQPSTSTSKEEKPKPEKLKPEKPKPGRKKGRKGYVYEEMKPVESPKAEELQSDGRRRRRAAIAAERNFDTVADSVIDIDDFGSDAEFIPDKAVSVPAPDARAATGESHTEVKQEPAEDDYDKPIMLRKGTKAAPPMSKTKKVSKYIDTQTTNSRENSILLSDDEEPPPPPPKKKPGPARKTLRITETQETKKKVEPEVPEESDDIVPLHPSLLSNQNFIKIVAHTYLTGNPMLDEDAATLAAQYSTQKALKEYEATGNEIKTGPLHDIAIQVLGEEILKKLHVTKGKAPCKATQLAEPPPEVIKEKTPEPTPPAEPMQKSNCEKIPSIRLKIRVPETKRRSSKTSVTSTYVPPTMTSSFVTPAVTSSYVTPDAAPPFVAPTLPSAKVVPVGLFMGASELTSSNMNQSDDECILPDDDDMRIITDSPPATPYQAPTTSYQVPPTSYQAPPTPYRAPPTPYQAPATSYQAPPTPYQAPAISYQAPATSYQAPATSYQAPATSYQAPPTPYQAPVTLNQTPSTSYQASTPLYQAPTPSYQPPAKPVAIAPKTLSRRNSSLLNLNNVRSKDNQPKGKEEPCRVTGSIRLPATSSKTVIQPIMVPMISANKIILMPEKESNASQPAPVVSTALIASEQILSDLNNTISLDSDDEDDLPIIQIPNASNAQAHTRTPTTHTQPVPVSLTTAVTQIPTLKHSISSTSATGTATTALAPTSLGLKALNKKYFIMPSTHINKLTKVAEIPTSAVPIQLNRVPMLSNNVPPLLKPASEVPLQNASDVTESILPVTSTEAPNSSKRVCKPGDILRITKSGQIEVLNRKDKAAPAVAEGNKGKTPSAVAPASSTNATPPFTIDLDGMPAAPREIQTRNKNKKADSSGKPMSSNSNSVGSRSSSPFDPLSILRDVVHIEADDYGTQQSSKTNKTNKETLVKSKLAANTKAAFNLSSQKIDLTKSTQDHSTAESTKSTKQNQPKAEVTWHKVLSHKETGAKKSQPANFQPNLNKVSPVVKPFLEKKAATNARNAAADSKKRKEFKSDKTNASVIDITSSNDEPSFSVDRAKEKQSTTIIDITSGYQRPSGSADKTKEKQTKTRLGSTISGVSKDIIISGTGKAIKKSQSAPTPPVKTEKAKGLDSKKRLPTSTETSSAKKKKTDKLMTLKDFDIEDIDDIIELD